MKTLRLKFIALGIAVAGIIAACSLDEGIQECTYTQVNPITAVTGETTMTVTDSIIFDVTVKLANECGEFQQFTETNGFPKRISALSYYDNCQCGSQTVTITEPYKFKTSAPGTYELKFVTDDADEPIVKIITVTE